MTAGRRGRPSSSTRITPCIWPESPSDVTSAPSRPTAPPSAISSALTELVPRSRPRSIGEYYPCLWDERFSFIRAHHVLSPRAQESEPTPNEGPLRAPSSLLRFLFPHPCPDKSQPRQQTGGGTAPPIVGSSLRIRLCPWLTS